MENWEEIFDQSFCEKISEACFKKFKSLGKNGKPVGKEWTVFACVIKSEIKEDKHQLEVVSLGTGSKCIGEKDLPKNGDRLHDSHAEIIARRAFKLYLFDQFKITLGNDKSIFTLEKEGFTLKEGVAFHFYCTNVPCGDASIFLKDQTESDDDHMSENEFEQPIKKMKVSHEESNTGADVKSTPDICTSMPIIDDIHRTGAKCANEDKSDPKDSGRNYHVTGVLRTKPGRGDPTLSHCCSDKMFKWTVLGVQGGLLMPFLTNPIYLKTLTIGAGPFSHNALHRALHTRFEEPLLTLDLTSPFHVRPPLIRQSTFRFPFAKPSSGLCDTDQLECKPSSASIIWSDTSKHKNKAEVSIDGKRLGTTKKNEMSPKSRVSICRIELLRGIFDLIEKLKDVTFDLDSNRFKELSSIDVGLSYNQVKCDYSPYNRVWNILRDQVLFYWKVKPIAITNFVLDNCD